jgi:glycerol-3-phosphate dehydrogenase
MPFLALDAVCIYKLRPGISILQVPQMSAKTRVRQPMDLMGSKGLHVVLSFIHQHPHMHLFHCLKVLKRVKLSLCLTN